MRLLDIANILTYLGTKNEDIYFYTENGYLSFYTATQQVSGVAPHIPESRCVQLCGQILNTTPASIVEIDVDYITRPVHGYRLNYLLNTAVEFYTERLGRYEERIQNTMSWFFKTIDYEHAPVFPEATGHFYKSTGLKDKLVFIKKSNSTAFVKNKILYSLNSTRTVRYSVPFETPNCILSTDIIKQLCDLVAVRKELEMYTDTSGNIITCTNIHDIEYRTAISLETPENIDNINTNNLPIIKTFEGLHTKAEFFSNLVTNLVVKDSLNLVQIGDSYINSSYITTAYRALGINTLVEIFETEDYLTLVDPQLGKRVDILKLVSF